MRPAIEVRQKNDATRGRPVQICSAFSAWWRAAEGERALPELLSFAGACVGGPDGPRLGTLFENGFGSATVSRSSSKGDAFTVRRPAWARIA
jgi:hypothetical protein